MLNMLLVIIFENYSKALSNVGPNAKTLSFQLYEALRRVIQAKQGKRVPLPHIVECLRKDWLTHHPEFEGLVMRHQIEKLKADSRYVKWESLIRLVSGMPRDQAERLGKKAWGVFYGEKAWEIEDKEEEAAKAESEENKRNTLLKPMVERRDSTLLSDELTFDKGLTTISSNAGSADDEGKDGAESDDRIAHQNYSQHVSDGVQRARLDAMEEQLAKLTQAVMLVNQTLQTLPRPEGAGPGGVSLFV